MRQGRGSAGPARGADRWGGPPAGRRALVRAAGACLALLTGPILTRPAAAQETRFFRLSTGTVTGTYFAIGGLLADALSSPPGTPPCEQGGSCGVTGLVVVANSSSGSVDNVKVVQNGDAEGALVQSDIAFWALQGSGPFDGYAPADRLRAVANLYPEAVHLVAHPRAGIRSVEDLRGKRVALDDYGSGTLADARLILAAYGLSEAMLTPYYIKIVPAAAALARGEIDAFFMTGGYPLSVVGEAVRKTGAVLVPIEGPPAAELVRRYPFFFYELIPFDTYDGLPAIPTLGVGAQLIVSSQLDAGLVHALTGALWHPRTLEHLRRGHPRGRDIRLETALDGISVPLHPGAERWYRERGLLSDVSSLPR